MKKIIRICAALAASVLALSSCAKEIAPVTASVISESDGLLVEKTFTASSEDTKATVNGLSILWAAGDCIGVSTGSGVQKFSISGGSGTANASFSGTIGEADKYYAIYPYNQPGKSTEAAIMTTEGVFTTRFNHWYSSLKPGSLLFSPACAVSTDGNSLTFKNVGAILKFTVPESIASKLKKLEIGTTQTAEKITSGASGTISVDLANGNAVTVNNGSTLCTIQQAFSAGSYYIAVAPISLSNGYYLRLTFNNGASDYFSYRALGGSISLAANKIFDMGTVTDSDEIVLSEFNNGVISCQTTCNLECSNVDCSTVKEGATGKCMKYSVKGSGAGSGQVSFDLSNSKPDAVKVFSTKVRKVYSKTRIRVYLGELEWFPTMKYTNDYHRLPSSINGISLADFCKKNCTALTDGEVESLKELWVSAVRTDDWNEIEWDFSLWGVDGLAWNKNNYLNILFSTTPKGAASNLKYGESIYLDNIRFGVSDSARSSLIGI
ncbi:MAG: fimbrillin family protein [Bacteroidales bacterium]|nr:fimbrillin family protein [Bacteroidales bacterium]